MIGKLSGKLDNAAQDHLILDVSGVGYVVNCSPKTLSQCGQQGDPLSLLIETHVREDAITLYGFMDAQEQFWFRLLYSVQGVGPKAALAILGVCPADQLAFIIASGDKAAITRADGVGPKLATRILTELKDKAGKIDFDITPQQGCSAKPQSVPASKGPENDAVSALINLGYGRSDAYAAVMQVKQKANDNEVSLEEMIRLALKELSA